MGLIGVLNRFSRLRDLEVAGQAGGAAAPDAMQTLGRDCVGLQVERLRFPARTAGQMHTDETGRLWIRVAGERTTGPARPCVTIIDRRSTRIEPGEAQGEPDARYEPVIRSHRRSA